MTFIYFGHPTNTYNTALEEQLVERIQEAFPNATITNPSHPRHEAMYQLYKEETGNGMQYYLEEILPAQDAGVFLGFKDGYFGAGVFKEAQKLEELHKPIYEIRSNGAIKKLQTHERWKLSIQETRERIKQPY